MLNGPRNSVLSSQHCC